MDSSFKLFSAVHELKCDACKVFNDGYNCNLKDRIYIIQWKTSISSLIILQKKRKLARWLSNIKYILSKYLLGGKTAALKFSWTLLFYISKVKDDQKNGNFSYVLFR